MVPPCPSALRHAGRRPTIKVEFMLGRGGQATVYAARRVRRSGFVQRVALKVAERHAQSEALLKREARLQAQLQHRHIVAAHDLLTLGGHLALLMEHVDGADLRRIACRAARQHNPSVRAVLEAGRDIAAALDHLDVDPHRIAGAEGRGGALGAQLADLLLLELFDRVHGSYPRPSVLFLT